MWGGEVVVKSDTRIYLGGTHKIRNNTGGLITNFNDLIINKSNFNKYYGSEFSYSAISHSQEVVVYLKDEYLRKGNTYGIRFDYNNKEYNIIWYNLEPSNRYLMSIQPNDLEVKMITLYNNIGPYVVLDIVKTPIRQTGIKSTISNLGSIRLLYNNRNAGLGNTHTPEDGTQPTNFSLKLYKFILYSGRYKEKEGKNRMIFEGNPSEEARRLGIDLRINDVDSSGVQTITLSNPISFNTEEYMRKHSHINLSKSIKFK